MKMIILVALALAAVAVAAPPELASRINPDSPVLIKIVRSEFNQDPEGSYQYNFETENGIQRQENGELKETVDEENKPRKVVVMRGSYSYLNPDGTSETVNYYADETGFHAEGPSIPKAAGATARR